MTTQRVILERAQRARTRNPDVANHIEIPGSITASRQAPRNDDACWVERVLQ
jgi:hypothetical protein